MCTGIRFTDGQGNMYFGRNLDWSCGYGEHVVITPTGWSPNSPFGAIDAISRPVYGMGIVAENTPLYFDCANDAGLAVAGLNFPGYAQYESAPVQGKTNVCAWEFPLWVVANFHTVDEVKAALAETVIVDRPINDRYPSSLLHWIIGDADRSIVVEYTAKAPSSGVLLSSRPTELGAACAGFPATATLLRVSCAPRTTTPSIRRRKPRPRTCHACSTRWEVSR